MIDPRAWQWVALASSALLLGACSLLLLLAWRRLGYALRGLQMTHADIRGLRQQVSNVIRMLQNAGFKVRPSRDWNDDERKTGVLGETSDTKWDWRAP